MLQHWYASVDTFCYTQGRVESTLYMVFNDRKLTVSPSLHKATINSYYQSPRSLGHHSAWCISSMAVEPISSEYLLIYSMSQAQYTSHHLHKTYKNAITTASTMACHGRWRRYLTDIQLDQSISIFKVAQVTELPQSHQDINVTYRPNRPILT